MQSSSGKMKAVLMLLAAVGFLAANMASADDTYMGDTMCPANAQASMDATFGAGTSSITHCIGKHHNIKVAISMSTSTLNPAKGISQTIVNVQNMVQNYEGMYGLSLGSGYNIAVVGHFAGGRFLLTDEAYNRTYGVTTGNPTRTAVQALLNHGITFIMCQNTMRANHWTTADVIPGVQEAPAGVVALTDYGMRGWVVLTP